MKTFIELKKMHFYAYHGVLPEETLIGNNFEVNLKIQVNFEQAFISDDVNDTYNYAVIYDIIKKEMSIPSKLLEHVGGRIYNSIKEYYPDVRIVELRIAKMNPPVAGQVDCAEITVTD